MNVSRASACSLEMEAASIVKSAATRYIPRLIRIWLRHECRNNSMLEANCFGGEFEQRSGVCHSFSVGVSQGGLKNTRACFGMMSFYLDAEFEALQYIGKKELT